MSCSSAKFEGGDSEKAEHDRHDPEAGGDGALLPTGEFKVMMQGGHLKDALTGEFEAGDLKNHREGFRDKNSADNRQKQFLFAADSQHSQDAPDGKRSGVAHENAGRMAVPPEEAKCRTGQGEADNRQFSREVVIGNLEIDRRFEITRMPKQVPAITVQPEANPSSPSVRFTALEVPTMMRK